MNYEIWEAGGREPVSTYDTEELAHEALRRYRAMGIDNLEVRPAAGHAGEIFPGGVKLYFPE